MLDIDRTEIQDGEFADSPETGSTALVPVAVMAHWAPKIPLPHADPSFVTQLIATAERDPQTRSLRRGSAAEAQSAYGPHVSERRSVSRRTRQVI